MIGGAVGGAAWVSTVGSGIVAIRLSKANLPAESVVALMSDEHRFVIGAGYLLVPLLAGALVFLADLVLLHAGREDADRVAAALIVVTIGYGIAYFLLGERHGEVIAQYVATVVILLLIVRLKESDCSRLHEQVILFLTTLVVLGAIALIAEALRAPVFERITITLTNHSYITNRYYVTTTDQSIVMISLLDCPAIDVVPRAAVARIVVGPERVRVTPSEACKRKRAPTDD